MNRLDTLIDREMLVIDTAIDQLKRAESEADKTSLCESIDLHLTNLERLMPRESR